MARKPDPGADMLSSLAKANTLTDVKGLVDALAVAFDGPEGFAQWIFNLCQSGEVRPETKAQLGRALLDFFGKYGPQDSEFEDDLLDDEEADFDAD